MPTLNTHQKLVLFFIGGGLIAQIATVIPVLAMAVIMIALEHDKFFK